MSWWNGFLPPKPPPRPKTRRQNLTVGRGERSVRKARRVRKDGEGECPACGHQFDYCLIHNGFNESAYACCDSCGITALLDGWWMPRDVRIPLHGVIPAKHEALLAACSCGGQYRYGAAPRCPHCHYANRQHFRLDGRSALGRATAFESCMTSTRRPAKCTSWRSEKRNGTACWWLERMWKYEDCIGS